MCLPPLVILIPLQQQKRTVCRVEMSEKLRATIISLLLVCECVCNNNNVYGTTTVIHWVYSSIKHGPGKLHTHTDTKLENKVSSIAAAPTAGASPSFVRFALVADCLLLVCRFFYLILCVLCFLLNSAELYERETQKLGFKRAVLFAFSDVTQIYGLSLWLNPNTRKMRLSRFYLLCDCLCDYISARFFHSHWGISIHTLGFS